MSYYGTIKLMFGKVIHKTTYTSREERRIILDKWERDYGEEFEIYEIRIIPNVIRNMAAYKKATQVTQNKLSRIANEISKKHEHKREPFVRPKAVYDNHRPYDETPDTYSFPAAVNR